ncbi:MAG: hypothetical protein H6834_09745 [Planctomycetes bacterium]|nr:hypothetical protein [Planctomycetota bacterium]
MKIRFAACALSLVAAASAQNSVQISIGLRETGAGGNPFTMIGGDGGFAGGIEWVNLDAQTLVLDGTWQQFTFNLTTDPITGFAGTTANSILEGDYGVLEHIRILNNNGVTDPITIWVDDFENTVTPMGGTPQTTNFSDFQNWQHGDEVMFQEPTFSGSTDTNIVPGATAVVDNYVAARSASDRFDFQFVDGVTTRWLRMTTYQQPNLPNPLVRFDDQSVVTFWMRGGKAQQNLLGDGPGTTTSEIVGEGLATGQQSTYYISSGVPGTAGVVVVSTPGFPDFPVLGGTLISGTGYITNVLIVTDPAGNFSVAVPGTSYLASLVFQPVMVDTTVPQLFAFGNALYVDFGL